MCFAELQTVRRPANYRQASSDKGAFNYHSPNDPTDETMLTIITAFRSDFLLRSGPVLGVGRAHRLPSIGR